MSKPVDTPVESHQQFGAAFLLTQLGTHAATRFGERVGELALTPPQVGMLRLIGQRPGMSQQALADHLGLLPSKVVSFVDELEGRELLARSRSARDRRVYELTLTDHGRALMGSIREVAAAHDAAITEPLDDAERAHLVKLLRRLAEHHGLTPGVHPGYRKM